MNIKSLFYCGVVFACSLSLTACRQQVREAGVREAGVRPAGVAPASSEVYLLKNGLRVEVLPYEQNDIAQALDMRMHRLKVTWPSARPEIDTLNFNLEVRRKDRPVQRIGGLGITRGEKLQHEVLINLYPLEGSWGESEKMKAMVQTAGGRGSNVVRNPFFKRRGGLNFKCEFSDKDDSFTLIDTRSEQDHTARSAASSDVAIVFTIEAMSRRRAK
jgi:hypothetical protein